MSYEIYKSIKQLNDGSFECICADSNIYPKYWSKYHMTFFNENYPTANKEELRAIFELYSTGSGDKFYCASWKDNVKLASKFMAERNYDWWSNSDHDLWLRYAKEFIAYKKTKAKIIKKRFVVSLNFSGMRQYVLKKSKARCWPSYSKDSAKKFTAETKEEIEKLFAGYSNYQPIVEEL